MLPQSLRPSSKVMVAAAALLLCAACANGEGDTMALDSRRSVHALPSPPCAPTASIGGSFVRREGSSLLLDGEPFRALGANVYYLQQLFADAEQGQQRMAEPALQALDHMVCLGLGVVRTVGFNDSDDSESIRLAPGMYREAGLRGLDRAVAEAKARGLRVILPLVNNWEDYGGLPRYAVWAGKAPEAQDDFFSAGPMRAYWEDYAAMLTDRVNTYTGVRYRDEPAILAWELGNELRCRSCLGSTRVADTLRELATYLKGLAPDQLVGDGGDGLDDAVAAYPRLSNTYWVRGAEGVSFSTLLEIDALDLASYHMYFGPDGFQVPGDAEIWIDNHQRLARMANKVAYLGEFGLAAASNDRDTERAAAFDGWLERLFVHNQGQLGILWQIIPASRRGLGDDYGVVYDEDPATASVVNDWALTTQQDQ